MLIKNAVLVTLQVLVTTIHCQLGHYQIYMVKHSLKVFQARKWLCFDRLNKLVTESLKLYCTEICFVFQICHFRLSRPHCKIQVTRSDLCVQANACYAVCCLQTPAHRGLMWLNATSSCTMASPILIRYLISWFTLCFFMATVLCCALMLRLYVK